jgi:hypothetical protein
MTLGTQAYTYRHDLFLQDTLVYVCMCLCYSWSKRMTRYTQHDNPSSTSNHDGIHIHTNIYALIYRAHFEYRNKAETSSTPSPSAYHSTTSSGNGKISEMREYSLSTHARPPTFVFGQSLPLPARIDPTAPCRRTPGPSWAAFYVEGDKGRQVTLCVCVCVCVYVCVCVCGLYVELFMWKGARADR